MTRNYEINKEEFFFLALDGKNEIKLNANTLFGAKREATKKIKSENIKLWSARSMTCLHTVEAVKIKNVWY